jgi:hypothetical protein
MRYEVAAAVFGSGVHRITNPKNLKEKKRDLYRSVVLSPGGCMYGLSQYTGNYPDRKLWALVLHGFKHDADNYDATTDKVIEKTELQILQEISHRIVEEMNNANDAAKEKT